MKLTFPHMGSTYLSIKALFDDLGVETIVPKKSSKRTLELGIKYAPELICLPLKINLGNYLESIEQGADTIVGIGSCGPCRYGYYAEVQKEIFKDIGIDVEFVVLEAPEGDILEFYKRVSKISNTKNVYKIGKSLKNAIKILKKLNDFEGIVLKTRPYEKYKGTIDTIMEDLINRLEKSQGSSFMLPEIEKAMNVLKKVPLKKADTLKVGIVGEIYTVIEDFCNFDIGKKLNDLGVEVHKSLTAGEWIMENLFYRTFGRSNEDDVRIAATPYMNTCIGGHARETLGHSILYNAKGYDGAVQVLPFGCMPEIVAMSILPTIQEDKNFPILTLIIDEMTGEAGTLTRIEAFVDLLRNRKEKTKNEKLLSWH